MSDPFLVILDVDGTLIDSEDAIVEAARIAFAETGLMPPMRDTIRRTVGLSVPRMLEALAPGATEEQAAQLVAQYRLRFNKVAEDPATATPFPGVPEGLDALRGAGAVLALATGKSARGLAPALERLGGAERFAAIEHADTNPSKPHPSMIRKVLDATGIAPERAVMVGDTSFDVEMAAALDVGAVAVGYGHHDADTLRRSGARTVAATFAEAVEAVLEAMR